MGDVYYRNLQHTPSTSETVILTVSDIVWKISNFIVGLFFLVAAAVQYNDPDPFIWITVYIVPGLLSVLLAFIPIHLIVKYGLVFCIILGVHLLGCMFGGLILASTSLQSIAQFVNPLAIEEGRELCGLVIVTLWIFITILYIQKKQKMMLIFVSNRQLAVFASVAIIAAFIPPMLWGLCFIDSVSAKLTYCNEMSQDCALKTALVEADNVTDFER